jgi:hypothetical protein
MSLAAPSDNPNDVHIVNLLPDPLDQRYVVLLGYKTLQDVTALSAYMAWKPFGARLVDRRRYASPMFGIICREMKQQNLRFTDTEPDALTTWSIEEFQDLTGKKRSRALVLAAKALASFNLGPQLLGSLNDAELLTLQLGPQQELLVRQARHILQQK